MSRELTAGIVGPVQRGRVLAGVHGGVLVARGRPFRVARYRLVHPLRRVEPAVPQLDQPLRFRGYNHYDTTAGIVGPHSVSLCSPPSRLSAALRPRFAGLRP